MEWAGLPSPLHQVIPPDYSFSQTPEALEV
jgi:hypothetical protein